MPQISIHMRDGEVEDLPSWRNPHRRGLQALTSPGVEKSTEAWWKDKNRVIKIRTLPPTFSPPTK